jgi:hypothetical protein
MKAFLRGSGILLILLFVAPPAFAQATRTWVSGEGDDANPCSRTAPCKTFAGAISKTAPHGEINCLDPGGFGGVTITKSLTIDCAGTLGGVLAAGAGVNGIVINALATDVINLRRLQIDGLGNAQNGVRILKAKLVTIDQVHIFGFGATDGRGVDVDPSTPTENILVRISNSQIEDNRGAGVRADNGARVIIINSGITGNGGTTGAGVEALGIDNPPTVLISNSHISGNHRGIRAVSNATVRITHNDIYFNTEPWEILKATIETYLDNRVFSNGIGGVGGLGIGTLTPVPNP